MTSYYTSKTLTHDTNNIILCPRKYDAPTIVSASQVANSSDELHMKVGVVVLLKFLGLKRDGLKT